MPSICSSWLRTTVPEAEGVVDDNNSMHSDKHPSDDEDEPEPQRWLKRETELIIHCYEALCSWPLFLHLVMILSLVWLTGFMQYNYPLVVFTAMFYLHKVDNVQKERLRIQIQNRMDERRSRLLLSSDAETVVWLNAVLQECWPSWLERYLSHFTMNCLHLNLAYYKPRAVSKLVIDYLRLGSSPPVIHFAKVHRHPTAARGEHAVLELDISFVAADDMKLELIARLKKVSMGLGLAGKLYGNNLRVEGKLRLGLKFVPFYPYLGQLTVAFASVPALGLSVRPLSSSSVDVTDLPGIASWVSRAIQTAIETFLVEPNPLVVDMIKLCGADYRFDVDKDGTSVRGNIKEPKDAAFVILEILECKDLDVKDRTGSVDPYVKISLEKVKFKTSVKKQTSNPIWHELFRMRITSWGPPCRLLLRVRDRDAFGKDDELGCCFIDMDQLRGGKRHDMWLRLNGAKTGQIHVAATVVDISSRISVDYEEGSSSAGDTACPLEKDVPVDESVAMRAKMKQVKVAPCVDQSSPLDDASVSYRKIKHVRIASVDSDRFEGLFDFKGHPILEREGLSLPNGSVLSAAVPSGDTGASSSALPSVAEKVPSQRWETDNVVQGKTRKRRTFMFLKPRGTPATKPPTVAEAKELLSQAEKSMAKQGTSTSAPSKSHRMNLKSLYKRMSSEFRSTQDPASPPLLFEVTPSCSSSVRYGVGRSTD